MPSMRVMFCTRAGAGHFGPLVPFAKAFLRNNDEVVFVAPAESAAMIAGAGFDHALIPNPPAEGRAELFARARRMSWDEANVVVVRDLFVATDTPANFPHVVNAIETHRPDVVLWEASDFAAALAAEATGVPAVCIGITQARHREVLADVVTEALEEVRPGLGLPPDPTLGRMDSAPYFTLMPEEFEDPEAPGPPHALRFRERIAEARPLPDWWENDDLAARLPDARLGRPDDGLLPRRLPRRTRLAQPPARARAGDGRSRPRPRRSRSGRAERARRPLGPAGRRDAPHRRDDLPRRIGHGARGPRRGRPAGGAPAVRRPAVQRAPGHRARGRHHARPRRQAPATPCAGFSAIPPTARRRSESRRQPAGCRRWTER